MAGGRLWVAAERPEFTGALLLDTHVWVWTLEGDMQRLAPAAIRLIERAARDARCRVSDISFWEVAIKAAKGKLVLGVSAAVWLRQAERAPGVVCVPLDRATLIQSAQPPLAMHGDPADRMLIAAAQLHDMTLLTLDENIIEFAASEPGIPVCDGRR